MVSYHPPDVHQERMGLLNERGGKLSDWLADEDHHFTCNPKSDEKSIRFLMPKARFSHWIRVATKEIKIEVIANELKLLFATASDPEDLKGCEHKVIQGHHNETFDIYCTTEKAVSYIIIQGLVVAKLCAIYVSEGRQVSLKLSAPSEERWAIWQDYNAKFICPEDQSTSNRNSNWTLEFGVPVFVEHIVIHYHIEEDNVTDLKLPNASVNLILWQNESTIFQTEKVLMSPPHTIYPDDQPSKPATRLEIIKADKSENLRFCAVQRLDRSFNAIFPSLSDWLVEFMCPPRKYGVNCDFTCNCYSPDENCFVATGGCSSGCAAGFTGEDCKQTCSDGFYGRDCKSECSSNCEGGSKACNHFNGSCEEGCKEDFQPPLCLIKEDAGAVTTTSVSVKLTKTDKESRRDQIVSYIAQGLLVIAIISLLYMGLASGREDTLACDQTDRPTRQAAQQEDEQEQPKVEKSLQSLATPNPEGQADNLFTTNILCKSNSVCQVQESQSLKKMETTISIQESPLNIPY
ncbi:reverse transcriptase [Plakobranchus ocellatus]|uniref:Reverse transcriptase n=1 Tax=Plakobranchus ocellatus TaxID=259542 RepID=A0AAV3WU40_9GAST|nr:reverse transcriptase [Plakobranchus ocellatus]